jgi:hypothetical protein
MYIAKVKFNLVMKMLWRKLLAILSGLFFPGEYDLCPGGIKGYLSVKGWEERAGFG